MVHICVTFITMCFIYCDLFYFAESMIQEIEDKGKKIEGMLEFLLQFIVLSPEASIHQGKTESFSFRFLYVLWIT